MATTSFGNSMCNQVLGDEPRTNYFQEPRRRGPQACWRRRRDVVEASGVGRPTRSGRPASARTRTTELSGRPVPGHPNQIYRSPRRPGRSDDKQSSRNHGRSTISGRPDRHEAPDDRPPPDVRRDHDRADSTDARARPDVRTVPSLRTSDAFRTSGT